jgi:hypothetical protein
MKTKTKIITLMAVLVTSIPSYAGKPLKVYILSGQSNMQGQAAVRTIERLNLTDDSKQMYQDMKVKDGMPSAAKDAYGVYFTAGDMKKGKARDLQVQKGALKPGFGGETTPETKFGPEYTFGIYMQKHLNEPILIIKTAWGGRDLLQQFRPPSAGKYTKDTDRHGNPIGHYYSSTIKHVKNVLADPSKYHPAYNKEDGFEIAGFVWFQGFNDLIGPYPGSKKNKDYSEYSRLMACFIRDVRKDLNTPKMPFVIGVMGIGGVDKEHNFRKAQAAPAALPEFKGNVTAVWTGQYWDMELERIKKKLDEAAKKKLLAEDPKMSTKSLSKAIKKTSMSLASPEEAKFLSVATSNAGFHYMGSAYTFGKIGKAFADAMAVMTK